MRGQLIAVVTCRARRAQADAQRRTWAAGRDDAKFFVGNHGLANDNEVWLPVDDGYDDLPAKVQAMCRWALENQYDSVLKVDDDVYLVPGRLPDYTIYQFDYVGNFRDANGGYPHRYASGFCYWLSRKSMEIVASAELGDTMEDRWVGQLLGAARVRTYHEARFSCTYPCGVDHPRQLWGSSIGRSNIAYAQYPADKFDGLRYWQGRVFHSDGI